MMERQESFLSYRRRYPTFEYKAFHWEVTGEGLRLWFDFAMGDIEFHPTAIVENRPFLNFRIPKSEIDRLVFDIGMIELISYWKCACPPMVSIACGSLTDEQAAFWRKLYWHGLGEFFYTNGISTNSSEFMEIRNEVLGIRKCAPAQHVIPNSSFLIHNSYLVPIGGGKDSVVTLELLRRAGKQIRPLIMNPRGATAGCARVAGFPIEEVLVIRRSIDPTLLELNKQGYLNGHTPFSAMLAFYTRLASALSGIPNVALSNESSANESTVIGTSVNHQYSKSLEFEDDFRNYCFNALMRKCVRDDTTSNNAITQSHNNAFNYFSFLRPLSELQIAMLFSRFTQYHDVFRSCNVGSKQDIWCGHCAKCLFAYIILSPFIPPERLDRIFGKPMLDDTTLQHEFLQLIGMAETKPFECVGTVSEVRQALTMTLERWYHDNPPALLKDFKDLKDLNDLKDLKTILPIGNLTQEERIILQDACSEKNS